MMNDIYTSGNLIRFPRERRCLDLHFLEAVEPDIVLADILSDRYGLAVMPFDLIERGELEARSRIAKLDRSNPREFHRSLRRMNEQSLAAAISMCRQAGQAEAKATDLRGRADDAAESGIAAARFLHQVAAQAERTAAILTLRAIEASQRARGVDAVVSWTRAGVDGAICYGIVSAG